MAMVKATCGHDSSEKNLINGECRFCGVAPRYELPALVGSEKQVAWATDIRATAYPALRKLAGQHIADPMLDRVAATALPKIAAVLAQTEAHWWIEHRAFGPTAAELVR